MLFKEAILKYDISVILKRLVEIYPEQEKNRKGYENVLKELRSLDPIKSDVKINVCKYFDEFKKQYYTGVDGIDEYNKTWAIEFTDWKEWLGMEINIDSFKEHTLLDIICHCLWEMTFLGYSRYKIEKSRNELKSRLDNIEKGE